MRHMCHNEKNLRFTHYGLVTPFGDIGFGQIGFGLTEASAYRNQWCIIINEANSQFLYNTHSKVFEKYIY